MRIRRSFTVCAAIVLLTPAPPSRLAAQVRSVADLNTQQIAALDRAKTVVILQGGMLEEHGPYLPAFTDGILSARLTTEVADGIAKQMSGWTVLVFPPISVGSSGSNEIGGHYSFPGTYAVRPSVLRAAFMDVASELGDQGFRWIMVVHVHGSPLHIGALDQAGDYFRDTYRGQMVNLWGLLPVLAGWGNAMQAFPDSVKKEDGLSLHGGLDEHSMMLYLAPTLVAPGYRTARTWTGANYDSAFATAKREGWPGYIGAPRLATREYGERIWNGFSNAAITTSVEILKGKDPASYPRYLTYLKTLPLYQGWIRASEERDAALGERQRAWLARQVP